MNEFVHPRVVVGVDGSITGLAALRTAAAEARRRRAPLHAIRARAVGQPYADLEDIKTAFCQALGAVPTDLEIRLTVSPLSITSALRQSATDSRDLIVVGSAGKGAWHAFWAGSVSRSLLRNAGCPVLAVPAPDMARTRRRPLRRHRLADQDLWERFDLATPDLRDTRRNRA